MGAGRKIRPARYAIDAALAWDRGSASGLTMIAPVLTMSRSPSASWRIAGTNSGFRCLVCVLGSCLLRKR